MQLPMGKIGSIWEIFVTDINTTYAPQLHQHLPAAQSSGEVFSIMPILSSLSHIFHLFVALTNSVLLINTTAATVLGLVSRTCDEIVSPLLNLAMSGTKRYKRVRTKFVRLEPHLRDTTGYAVRGGYNIAGDRFAESLQCIDWPPRAVPQVPFNTRCRLSIWCER